MSTKNIREIHADKSQRKIAGTDVVAIDTSRGWTKCHLLVSLDGSTTYGTLYRHEGHRARSMHYSLSSNSSDRSRTWPTMAAAARALATA